MRDEHRIMVWVGFVLFLAGIPIFATAQDSDISSSLGSVFAMQNTPSDPSEPKSATSESKQAIQIENSIVKVFATIRPPNFSQPWAKQPAQEVSGTGFVIEGQRILTNAHVVLYAKQVEVQGNQSSVKISASVEFIAPGIDLALLKLEDESFFESHAPLARTSDLPTVRDSVLVYGYPIGGSNLSITKGIVSRIDFTAYNYETAGLRVQIDAAINPGNSGGPALVGNKVVGVAFSMLANSQNIGYIIPCEEIDIFLSDITDGQYDGKYLILDELQTLENPALRDFLKLDESIEGLVVNVPFDTDPSYPLQQWDVITRIEDTAIDNEGNILLDDSLKISFSYLVQKAAKNGRIALTLVRDSREMSLELPLLRRRPRLIPHLLGTYPPYYILGPIVFSVASEDLVNAIMNRRPAINALTLSGNPLVTRRHSIPAFEGEELVIIPSPLFTHSLAKGYGHPTMNVVKTINGIKIKNLRHLVETIRDSADKFVIIEFDGYITESLVFDREEMINVTEEILNDNGIRNLASEEILAVWNQTE